MFWAAADVLIYGHLMSVSGGYQEYDSPKSALSFYAANFDLERFLQMMVVGGESEETHSACTRLA